MNKPLVSVIVITYNHEEYISECIRGILAQKVNFQIEIIIGDDCSTDETRTYIKKEIKKNQDPFKKINLLFHKKNLSSPHNIAGKLNWMACYHASQGKYIALCDGDDFWTDPEKLYKQVGFLEKNPQFNICHHEVDVFYEDIQELKPDSITKKMRQHTHLQDLVSGNFIHTPSAVLKKEIEILPQWFEQTYHGDYTIYVLNALKGDIWGLREKMAVYRVHAQGAMQLNKKNKVEQQLNFTNGLIALFNHIYKATNKPIFKSKLKDLHNRQRHILIMREEFGLMRKKCLMILKTYFNILSPKELILLFLSFCFPKLVRKNYLK